VRAVCSDTNNLSGPSIITEPRNGTANNRHSAHFIVPARDGKKPALRWFVVPVILADELIRVRDRNWDQAQGHGYRLPPGV
jgi:hypothetical protein